MHYLLLYSMKGSGSIMPVFSRPKKARVGQFKHTAGSQSPVESSIILATTKDQTMSSLSLLTLPMGSVNIRDS